MELFKGNCTAIVTPFTKNGRKVNYEVFKILIDKQIEGGVSAIVFLGTTGEAATLSQRERKKVISFAVNYVNKRVPVIIGSGSNNTKDAIKKCKTAQSLGADALLIVTPYYNKCTQYGLISHYKSIAKKVNLPIILYNVPSRTGVNILPKTVKELSKIKNIIAIKEASGNIDQMAEIVRICDPSFALYSGDDALTLPCLSIGGKGVISVVSNLYPQMMTDLCNTFFDGDIENSRKIQFKLNPLIKSLFIETNPIPIKEGLNIIGVQVGPTRLPLTKMNKENIPILKKEINLIKK